MKIQHRMAFISGLIALMGITWAWAIMDRYDTSSPATHRETPASFLAPVINCPANITISLGPGECTATVNYEVTAVDTTGEEPVLVQTDNSGYTSGDVFPIGTTVQSWLAMSSTGETACSFSVTVVGFTGSHFMGCNDTVNIGVDPNCEVYLFVDMILEGDHYRCYDDYIITVDQIGTDTGLLVFPASGLLDGFYRVTITDPATGNYCWGVIDLEDKIPPEIVCACPPGEPGADTCQILCLEVDLLAAGNIPLHLYPQIIENCCFTLEVSNIDVFDHGCDMGTVIISWLVTDQNGLTASCDQQFDILPLTIDSLVFPANYVGPCGSSDHPDVTGWPRIYGYDLTDQAGLCNLYLAYWDKPLDDCGGGRKILRNWSVLDWCTQEVTQAQQVLKLSDEEGPVLICPPDLSVGPDFWACTATVNVPKPQVHDLCSAVGTYSLASSAGTVIQIGNQFRIAGLPLGPHEVTWTVSDICGNTSSCSFIISVVDNVVPVANCDHHTVVSLTNDGPDGITLVPADVFDDGSYDHCGPITFRARRMTSCIDIDWTTNGGGIDDIPNGVVNGFDLGTVFTPSVPFACCDVPRVGSRASIMVELEVTDAAGNVNYCMVEIDVQDKIPPAVSGLPDISVSCDFWFYAEAGVFRDAAGNRNGNLDEDPLSAVFGNMFDAIANNYDESVRRPIIINDPDNPFLPQPYTWGLDGWVLDNCGTSLEVQVTIYNDCSSQQLPGNPPPGAVKLIERRFTIRETNQGFLPTIHLQRIWVVDFVPFYISDTNCNNSNPNDGVRWPCDTEITTCPDVLNNTGEPQIFADNCNVIGVTFEDTRFDFVDGACYKILREWKVIDWCQYNPVTGFGLWSYTQVIKVRDQQGPVFAAPCVNQVLCAADEGVSLPDNNQAFLGENNPLASSCSVHLNLKRNVTETCSDIVRFDVKLYPNNGTSFIVLRSLTTVAVDENNEAELSFDTRQNALQSIRNNGIPYNSPWCGDYHRILWSVEDGCGNWSYCQYLIRLEDCKQPSPVCINGLSTVVMPIGCSVTLWAKDFNASSFDDCTPSKDLLYSFSGDAYEPSKTFNATNIPAFGAELGIRIWVADGGTDDNCNGQISWAERNKDYCTTTIVFTDNGGNCGPAGGIVFGGDILTHHDDPVEAVEVSLTSQHQTYYTMRTADNGKYLLAVPQNGNEPLYTIRPERLDHPRNGVNTLDLVMIQKHLLGVEPFTSPYQYIAADADNSRSVSAVDLVEIRRLILGIRSHFVNNDSWRFVDKQFVFANPQHPWPFTEVIDVPYTAQSLMGLDLVAIKTGDINNTVQANAFQLLPRNGKRSLPVAVEAPEFISPGDIVEYTLVFPEPVIGFQWTLEAPELIFTEISSDDVPIGDDHIAVLDDGMLTVSWNAEDLRESPRDRNMSIRLRFTASGNGRGMDMIRLTDEVAAAEAYTWQYEMLYPVLTWPHDKEQPGFALYQNEPNPWTGSTLIGFNLPEAGPVRLTLFDMTGKTVQVTERDFEAGAHSIEVASKDIPAHGILYYRLESGNYAAVKKMVRIEN